MKERLRNAWKVLRGKKVIFIDFNCEAKQNVCDLFDKLPERADGYFVLINERTSASLAELEQYEQLAIERGDFKSAALLRDKIKERKIK